MKSQNSIRVIIIVAFSILIGCDQKSSSTEHKKERSNEKETKQPFPIDKWTTTRANFGTFKPKEYIESLDNVREFNSKSKTQFKKSSALDLDQNWLSEGPGNIGGRFNTLAIQSDNPNIIYAGAGNGGVFKTIDGGLNWNPIFDDFAYLAISSIEIDPNNSDIIYVGTGDRNFGGGSHIGNGIYKSIDAGISWVQSGLVEPSIVSEIIIDPNNSDILYVATLGNVYDNNNHRGVYKSLNSGSTWENILFISDSSGAIDLVMDPNNSDILYTSIMNRSRGQFTSKVTGPDVGIYKTINGGTDWNELTNGLPTGLQCRIGLAISNDDPNTLYASYTDSTLDINDVYKTIDAGANWSGLNVHASGLPNPVQGNFGWYFGEVYLNPYNNQQLIIPGVDMYTTTDLGLNWYSNVPPWYFYEVHADKHAIAFIDSLSYIIATDGGLYKTIDNGVTWEDIENIPVTQFYHIAISNQDDGIYGGGAQDNGSMHGNSTIFNSWVKLFGGDGFRMTYSIYDGYYVETQNGGLRYIDNYGDDTNLNPNGYDSIIVDWDMPYVINEQVDELFVGGNKVLMMESAPFGSYETISGDLTKVATGSYEGRISSHVILEMDQPKNDPNTIFVGTSDGLVWRGNRVTNTWQWTNITQDLPNRMVTALRVSPNNPQTLFVGYSGYALNDYEPYLYKSIDNGATWLDISGNLPSIVVNDILSPEGIGADSLFAALDGGVYFTEDGGNNWNLVGNNLPLLTMSELALDYENEKLIVGTYSRSMYSFDVEWLFEDITSPPIGVDENNLELTVSPNPTQGLINFPEGKLTKIEIYNIHGQLMMQEDISETQTKINIGQLSQGTYFFKSGKYSQKIVKN